MDGRGDPGGNGTHNAGLVIRKDVRFDHACRSVHLRQSWLELLRKVHGVGGGGVDDRRSCEWSAVHRPSGVEEPSLRGIDVFSVRLIVRGTVVRPAFE